MIGETVAVGIAAKFWAALAAVVGAFTGAWLTKPASKTEFAISVALGALASLYVAPVIIEHFFPGAKATSQVVAMTYWAVGTGSMTLIPSLLKRGAKAIADARLPSEPKI